MILPRILTKERIESISILKKKKKNGGKTLRKELNLRKNNLERYLNLQRK